MQGWNNDGEKKRKRQKYVKYKYVCWTVHGQIRSFSVMWDAGHDWRNYVICELAESLKIVLWMLSEIFIM
jgi:hypothetical protein